MYPRSLYATLAEQTAIVLVLWTDLSSSLMPVPCQPRQTHCLILPMSKEPLIL